MIKLSKLTDYAVVILGQMSRGERAVLQTSVGLSQSTGLPEPTVAKVLKLLVKGGLVTSSRGVKGGYQLTQSPEAINMARVLEAVEGPVVLTSCVEGKQDCCSHAQSCSMKGKWNPVNDAMKMALENVSLAQMMSDEGGCA